MILGNKQRIKTPERGVDHFSVHLFKTHLYPNIFSVFYRLVYKMFFPTIDLRNINLHIISAELLFFHLQSSKNFFFFLILLEPVYLYPERNQNPAENLSSGTLPQKSRPS